MPLRIWLLSTLLLSVTAAAAPAQSTSPARSAETLLPADGASELVLHHSAPRAGTTLTLVVEGAPAGADVSLVLYEAADAPPSLLAHIASQGRPDLEFSVEGALATFWTADARGLVVLSVPLLNVADADRSVHLTAHSGDVSSELLSLHVQAPMVVVSAADGLERLDLRGGERLVPGVPDVRGMLGLALSATGEVVWVLREGGLLEERSATRWDAPRLKQIAVHGTADGLASSRQGGAAFVLARPQGEPFTPSGQVLFLDQPDEPLLLAPMGQPVTGRRWAVTEDGLSAFVAEDDLLVAEIDLISRQVRATFPVGLVGDGAIVDMMVQDRRLYVVTSRAPNRSGARNGALTLFDLDTGTLAVHTLDVAPRRLVSLGEDEVLVVPDAEPFLQVVRDGVVQPPQGPPPAGEGVAAGGHWIDAAATDRGAVLLRQGAEGRRHLDLFDGAVLTSHVVSVPDATRVVGAGFGVVVLLGEASGQVYRVDLEDRRVDVIPGVDAIPGAPFVVLR